MQISFGSRISIHKDVLVNELDGESVLLHMGNETYYGLEEVGTRFWNVLQESESIDRAYETLRREYDIDPETLRKDIEDFLAKLLEHRLIEIEDP